MIQFQFQRKFNIKNMGTNVPIKVVDIVLNCTQMIGTGRIAYKFLAR